MKYEDRKEVVTHSVPQRVTLILCTRCGARPDGLDDTRSPWNDTLFGWGAPHVLLSMVPFQDRTQDAHAEAHRQRSDISLCPACTKAFHEFMAAGTKGAGE